MKSLQFLFSAFLVLSLLPGCGGPEDKALRALERENYSFNPAEFIRAASSGDEEAVRNFLAAGMDPQLRDPNGSLALVTAASQGQQRIVQLLLRSGADPDATAQDAWTALMMAAFNNHPVMVETLLAAGADTDRRDKSGWTALMQAVYRGHLDVVRLLAPVSTEGLDRAMLVAALMGHDRVIDALVASGAEINARTEEGDTALILAAQKGHDAAVRTLLDRGADPALVNNVGESALQAARERGFTQIAERLGALASAAPADAAVPPVQPHESTPDAAEDPEEAVFPLPDNSVAVTAAPPASVPGDLERNPQRLSEAELFEQQSEAWFARHGLDLSDPEMLDQDPDEDGFTNREEFLADTDPRDPGSHPKWIVRAEMTDFHQTALPVVLESVDSGGATFRGTDSQGTIFRVAVGGDLPGLSYRLMRVRERSIVDKDGNPGDVSEAALRQAATGAETTLVRGIPATAGDASAQIHLRGHGHTVQVRPGGRFTLPGEEETNYEVIEVRSDQVIVRDSASGATHTIFMAPR